MSEQDVFLAIHNFSDLNSLANNTKFKFSLKFLVLLYFAEFVIFLNLYNCLLMIHFLRIKMNIPIIITGKITLYVLTRWCCNKSCCSLSLPQCFLRAGSLRHFGYYLSSLENLTFSYNEEQGSFIAPSHTGNVEENEKAAMDREVLINILKL